MGIIVLEPEVIEIPEPDISGLVTENDAPVDNIFSEKQQRLLTESLYSDWAGPADGQRSFIALANVGLFYAAHKSAVVPDVLVSLDVSLPDELWEKKHRSYFIWEYAKPPEMVIEVVSNRQGGELDHKKSLYASLGIAYYVVFDPALQLSERPLHLFERRQVDYVPLEQPWFPGLELGMMLWQGSYEGQPAQWLRWCRADGGLILTGAELAQQERERAMQERKRAMQERERAMQERERAERLAAQLRAAGIEPDV